MIPAPNLQELIDIVRADAPTNNALDQLAQASRTVADLEEISDALLGHFVDRCRHSGLSWSEISGALGVSKQAAHKRFSVVPTFERFTLRAQAVMRSSADQARALGHGYVGTEHLLLALFEPVESVAAQVMSETGITYARCEAQILTYTPKGPRAVTAKPPFTPKAVDVLRRANDQALQLGHNYVGTEHLLLSLFGDADALSAKTLTALDVGYDDIRDRIIEKLSGFTNP
ncbi:MAG: Clp protease N-terminal domain-containing protein [Acidimicrobiia bacterium]